MLPHHHARQRFTKQGLCHPLTSCLCELSLAHPPWPPPVDAPPPRNGHVFLPPVSPCPLMCPHAPSCAPCTPMCPHAPHAPPCAPCTPKFALHHQRRPPATCNAVPSLSPVTANVPPSHPTPPTHPGLQPVGQPERRVPLVRVRVLRNRRRLLDDTGGSPFPAGEEEREFSLGEGGGRRPSQPGGVRRGGVV